MIVTVARGKTWSSEKLVLCCFHYIMSNFIFHITRLVFVMLRLHDLSWR